MKKWISILGLIACLGAGYCLWGKAALQSDMPFAEQVIVGGPMCGPICGPDGPHYWERDCDGKVTRTNIIDSNYDTCAGTATGQCRIYEYGKTEEGYTNMQDIILVETVECTELLGPS